MQNEKPAEPEVTDDVSEFDQLWDADDSSDTGEPAPAAEAAEVPPEPASTGDTGGEDDIETLRHKVSSAEGRYKKFQNSMETMQNQLATLEASQTSEPEPEPEKEPEPALPEGWTQDDWDDYRSDNPVGAELYQSQNREVEQLREQVSQTTQQQQQEQAQKEFNAAVMADHPDYLELLGNQREDIRTFIESESSPLLRQTYEGVYRQGTPEQVSELMTAFKASRPDSDRTNLQQRRVQDALAVPGKSPTPNANRPKGGAPGEDDFDSAWDYFSDDSID